MEYNIIEKYIKFLKKEFSEFFKIILREDYSKKICDTFINKYMSVRYYDETDYPNETDFLKRMNKELHVVYKELVTDESADLLKNIFALFGYLMCFDDTDVFVEVVDLINALVSDESIKITYDEETKKNLLTWCRELDTKKNYFNNSIISNEFSLTEHRLCKSTYKLDLSHSVKVSNLYSEYAINKVYNSGVIYEERLLITYILATYQILENARNLDFSKKYIIDFPSSIFGKVRKTQKLFNIINNPLTKKCLSLMITYTDYKNNEEVINNYIAEGFSFGIIIDSSYSYDINNLILFNYVFITPNSEFYDMIISDKDKIKTKIVVL